jgi:hypothetical protein
VRRMDVGRVMVRAVVLMVPTDVPVPLAVRLTLVGTRLHVESTGAPVQVSATVPVKELVESRPTVTVALLPAVTVLLVGARPRTKSGVVEMVVSATV